MFKYLCLLAGKKLRFQLFYLALIIYTMDSIVALFLRSVWCYLIFILPLVIDVIFMIYFDTYLNYKEPNFRRNTSKLYKVEL